jgi:hypothetical protein
VASEEQQYWYIYLLDLCSGMHIALFGPIYIHAVAYLNVDICIHILMLIYVSTIEIYICIHVVAHLNVDICIHKRDIDGYMQWHILMLIDICIHKRGTCIRNRDTCILISYINVEPSCLYDLVSSTNK